MKIIVSTQALAMCIEAAILDNCKNIVITPYKKEIRFVCEHDNLELEIEVKNTSESIMAYTFNPIQMYKLMVFLNLLPEQPIVIDLYQRTNGVSIELTQFVQKF